MTLTKLQKNLYQELLQHVHIQDFIKGYEDITKNLPKPQQAFYTREFVFLQGYVYGTPANLPKQELTKLFIKAGYKQVSADRTWLAFNKVMKKIYELV